MAGEAYLEDVRQELDNKRDFYPSVSQDFIMVIEAIHDFLDEVQEQIDEFEDAVDDFNQALQEAAAEGISTPPDFYFDGGRLPTQDDIDEMESKEEELQSEIDDLE